jgi:transcriptional regulator with XRE-family HTH domain
MPKYGPMNADRVVGQNIRRYRLEQSLSQTDLAEHLGLTFQQVQKYEKGTNRVGAGRLIAIARFLGCTTQQLLGDEGAGGEVMPDLLRELGQSRQGLELARAFTSIESSGLRETLVKVAQAFADMSARRARLDIVRPSAGDSAAHPPPPTHAPNAAQPSLHGAGRARPGS